MSSFLDGITEMIDEIIEMLAELFSWIPNWFIDAILIICAICSIFLFFFI